MKPSKRQIVFVDLLCRPETIDRGIEPRNRQTEQSQQTWNPGIQGGSGMEVRGKRQRAILHLRISGQGKDLPLKLPFEWMGAPALGLDDDMAAGSLGIGLGIPGHPAEVTSSVMRSVLVRGIGAWDSQSEDRDIKKAPGVGHQLGHDITTAQRGPARFAREFAGFCSPGGCNFPFPPSQSHGPQQQQEGVFFSSHCSGTAAYLRSARYCRENLNPTLSTTSPDIQGIDKRSPF
jgi:hypothetical protein